MNDGADSGFRRYARNPIPAKAGISLRDSANGGFAFRRMRFRLSPEWCVLIKRLKVPPFRRKPESPRRRRKISRRFATA
ncbi:MAG: hypothetical protein ACR2QC_09170 [Gammaproteobacteria bacterium]